jgi:hypothetical protein
METTSERTRYRPPRALILRGAVTTTYAAHLPTPSWHLDPSCGGLERVEPSQRDTREFADVWALAEDTDGRLCRMCTLESVLRTILRVGKRAAETPTTRVTFSSRPDPFAPTTTSGEARLRRLARALHLATVNTPHSGLTAYACVPTRAITVLETNLETHPLPWVRSTPTDEHLQCFWTLLGDLGTTPEFRTRRELWTSSRLLTC